MTDQAWICTNDPCRPGQCERCAWPEDKPEDIVQRLRERMLVSHGGPAGIEHGWNLTNGDSELHADAADEIERLSADAARWRWWRNRWPALTRMEVARFAGLDLSRIYVNSPEQMDEVTDAAMVAQEKT